MEIGNPGSGLGIVWLGHNSFKITSPTLKIVIDPYKVDRAHAMHMSEAEKADVVLITHEHFDHCEPASIDMVKKKTATLVAPAKAAAKLGKDVKVVSAGDSFLLRGIQYRVMPAYNVRHDRQGFHPKSAGGVGYIVSLGGQTIYHLGDTDEIPEMRDVGPIDVALVPVSGQYVMDAKEAAACMKTLHPQMAIPMHYGTLVGTAANAEEFKRLATAVTNVMILTKIKI